MTKDLFSLLFGICTYNQEFVKIRTSMNTKPETMDIYKPKLSWFSFADSFLRKNYEINAKLETNLVRFHIIFVFFNKQIK